MIVAAALMLLLTVALIFDVVVGMRIKYTLEAGDPLPPASKLSGRAGAQYDLGDEDEVFDEVGEYTIYIIDGRRRITVTLIVEDTTAPKAELLALLVHKTGPFPEAIDFFKDVKDASAFEAKFKNDVNPTELGEYEILLELADEHGNKKSYKTKMTLIDDKEAPVIKGPDTNSITTYLGEGIAYRKAVEVTDNCFGEVTLDIDSSAVNLEVAGNYKVLYKATDAAGNSSGVYTLTVTVLAEKITQEMLMEKIGVLASQLGITKDMSKEEQVKKIFKYVNSPGVSAQNANVRFTNESNTDRSDWIREAYYTLQNESGDCYSYFALSKAFFEYFGIENLDIERAKNTGNDGTHFWSMVNIGAKSAPRWYYYDATRLAIPHSTGSGCLFTEAQLEDYNQKKNNFLAFDHTGYPTASTQTINTNYGY